MTAVHLSTRYLSRATYLSIYISIPGMYHLFVTLETVRDDDNEHLVVILSESDYPLIDD